MKKLLFLLFTLLHTANAIACLQEDRIEMNGKIHRKPGGVFYFNDSDIDSVSQLQSLHERDSIWKSTGHLKDYSNYGVSLVFLGRYKEALAVFKYIESKRPGEYYTAANMGTTYELLGQNKLAYEWIKKSIEIDPTSHRGSEWLHLKILEAKIKGDNYQNGAFLLGTTFGNDSIPSSKWSKGKLDTLAHHIWYQLSERVRFIQPKDKIVAALFFEFGNITAITEDATVAYRMYEKAIDYGYSSEVFDKRWAYVSQLQAKLNAVEEREYKRKKALSKTKQVLIKKQEPTSDSYLLWGIGAGIIVLIVSILFLVIRNKKS